MWAQESEMEKVGDLRYCSSGPNKLGIFDIYRSTPIGLICLGLLSSLFKGSIQGIRF